MMSLIYKVILIKQTNKIQMKIFMRLTLGIVLLLVFSCKEKIVQETTIIPPLYSVASDIKWASPKGFDLTMDIYTPNSGKTTYPVIVMFHGGSWLINNKNIMKDASVYLASKSEYIVCNVNYRLMTDQNNSININEIIEDAFGAVIWVKDNITKYKGDPNKIIVTGDSAGGHLAMMTVLQGQNFETDGFAGNTLGFNPSYLPTGKTAEDVAKNGGISVQAAMLSYGVFDVYGSALGGFENQTNVFWSIANAKPRGMFGIGITPQLNPDFYKQVSPIYTIPQVVNKKLPPLFFSVGSKDNLTPPISIQAFITKLKEAGHSNIDYWVHEGRGHAFLDSGSNTALGQSFSNDAPLALDKMISFLNKIFY
jgi:acetyl esterase